MKKLILLPLIALMAGCQVNEKEHYSEIGEQAKTKNATYFETVIYDGCEYVINLRSQSATPIHKGNCKFCAERNKGHYSEAVGGISGVSSGVGRQLIICDSNSFVTFGR